MILNTWQARCAVALLTLAGPGCAYRGAIYSSYQEAGLGVRTTAESDAPVKVHFGYDRSVAAFVPRRGGDARGEEATALISRDDVGAVVNPTQLGSRQVLAVDSAFITGTAAIVASAPHGAEVSIVERPTNVQAALDRQPPVGTQTFTTSGSAGDRIGTALTERPALLSDVQVRLKVIHEVINARPKTARDLVYAKAAGQMPPEFQAPYADRIQKQLSPGDAFFSTELDFLQGQPDSGPRHEQLYRALAAANGEV